MCSSYSSSTWAREEGLTDQDYSFEHKLQLFRRLDFSYVYQMHFTGGEPLINSDHWGMLEDLINNGWAQNIALMYNTNLTTLKYKDKNIIDIWTKFKKVDIQCSIDAVGEPLEYIRSGTSWSKIKLNLDQLLKISQDSNINITLSPVLSILNIWFVDELYEYARLNNIEVCPIVLTGPDYLALDVVPDELKLLALKKINAIESSYNIDKEIVRHIKNLINTNINQTLFKHTISHILLLDNLRSEKLFNLLPFKSFAADNILKNHEYE
jgi:sulfatase maturation enzyme AslB (radical SAM superfamily)